MPWPDGEWQAFCALLDGWWPGELSEEEAWAYRVALADASPAAVADAMRRLLIRGVPYRPVAAELLRECRQDPRAETFEEAWVLIERAMPPGWGKEEDQRLLEGLAGHPLVRSFVERFGVRRVQEVQINDPQWGEQRRRELREAWDRHVEASEGREIAVLASGRGHDALRQLDPLATLPTLERSVS